jgi:hypothetical protein
VYIFFKKKLYALKKQENSTATLEKKQQGNKGKLNTAASFFRAVLRRGNFFIFFEGTDTRDGAYYFIEKAGGKL